MFACILAAALGPAVRLSATALMHVWYIGTSCAAVHLIICLHGVPLPQAQADDERRLTRPASRTAVHLIMLCVCLLQAQADDEEIDPTGEELSRTISMLRQEVDAAAGAQAPGGMQQQGA